MYNGMIRPLMPFRIKGAIWYQGENNVGDGYWYRYKLAAMVRNWRERWGIGEFPFTIAQLAGNGRHRPDEPCERGGWAEFREAQHAVTDLLPNVGTATLIDVGETNDVHAWNKHAAGRRLALWALARDYGRDIACSGPVYRSHRIVGNKVVVEFDSVGSGLTSARLTAKECSVPARKGKSEEWEVQIAKPEGVRYAWSGNPKANLYNLDGLPTLPFRTDDLELLIQGRKRDAWGGYTFRVRPGNPRHPPPVPEPTLQR